MPVDILNLTSLLYVGFRLAPFILVSFFVLSSIFNSDIRGILFLALLLCNCFATIIIGSWLDKDAYKANDFNGVCNAMSLTNTGPLSKVFPLNINVMSFTMAYLVQIMQYTDEKNGDHALVNSNIPMIIIFSLFILYNWYWLVANDCTSFLLAFGSMAIGFGLGWGFSRGIMENNVADLASFNGISNKGGVCKRPVYGEFECIDENESW